MKEIIQLSKQDDSEKFQKAFDIVLKQLGSTKNAYLVLGMLAKESEEIDLFFKNYCSTVLKTFGDTPKTNSFVDSLNAVREFAKEYIEVREYISKVQDIIINPNLQGKTI